MTPAVIFIDFDGVFHPVDAAAIEIGETSWRVVGDNLFCHAPILWDLIKDHDVHLVVHSSWRMDHELQDMLPYFPEAMRERIVAVTNPRLGRLDGILLYVADQKIERFLVLDDDSRPFPESWVSLVLCDGTLGLSDAHVQGRIRAFFGVGMIPAARTQVRRSSRT